MEIDEISCPICFMTFKRPLTITCGHTFCHSCLTTAIRDSRSCPICRQHVTFTPNKVNTDLRLQSFISSFERANQPQQGSSHQHSHTECKPEGLLLIDISTDDLLLPFNKITATFELQSSVLIDRMQRFVARQEVPFNEYGVLCHLVHVQELRRNLYRGVLQGQAFCVIQNETVESQASIEGDYQQFFYRSCRSKEIIESSETNPNEYNSFFMAFNRIEDAHLRNQVFHRVDSQIFTQRNDPVALFYSIIGILDIENSVKYHTAISFNEEKRVGTINSFLKSVQKKMKNNPAAFLRVGAGGSGPEKAIALLVLVLLMFFVFSNSSVEL